MEDFEIEVISENVKERSPIQLPLNFLSIGEIDNDDVRVYLKQDVYKELEKYAVSDTKHELGTILLGNYSNELGKIHVIISDFIVAKYTDATASTLTFTHETWEYVHKEHETKYPDTKIIGWQHTHPGYGVFLSNYDIFIEENFFSAPFQVAYVIDPIQHTRGFFQWKNDKVEKLKGFYVYDEIGNNIKLDTPKILEKNMEDERKSKINIRKWEPVIYGIFGVVIAGLLLSIITLSNKYEWQVKKQESLENLIANQDIIMEEQSKELESIKTSIREIEMSKNITDDNEIKEDNKFEDNNGEDKLGNNEEIPTESVYFQLYYVEAGDSLSAICKKYNLDYASNRKIILAINGIENPNAIYVGQMILLPVIK